MLITHMQVFALYAGLSGLIVLILAVLVSRARRKYGVALGEGGHPALQQAVRAHGNASEYVPIVLVLLLTLASMKASIWLIHLVGAMLVFGRILHGIGLHQSAGLSVGRGLGMALTWAALLVAAAACLFYALKAG
ncbi:MAG: MAPEG family protein [Alphaproteobacteria bacterium]|nr:MAPEG family protein [Alphaproteobacteria bacterium]